jgi:hypothetical protein
LNYWKESYQVVVKLQTFAIVNNIKIVRLHFQAWRQWTKIRHTLDKFTSIHKQSTLKEALIIWKWKMRNRLLLQRVFTIAQQSIGIRAERSNLSEFRFLKLLLNGWHELVTCRRQRRAILQAGQVLQSLLNQRSLVTAVSKWKSFSRKMKRLLIATIQQEKAVMQAAFLTWCIAMVNAKRLQSISVRKYTLHMQRRVFTTWKTLYTGKRAMAESFYLQRLKQKSFSSFRYYSRLVALDSILTAFDMKRLQKLLQGWKLATIALIRIHRGLD